MKYLLAILIMFASIGANADQLSTDQITKFNQLPDSDKGEFIAAISKRYEMYEAQKMPTNPSLIQQATFGVNMTPDQLVASPVGAAAVQALVQQKNKRMILELATLLVFTLVWMYIFRTFLIFEIKYVAFDVNGKTKLKKQINCKNYETGFAMFMVIVWVTTVIISSVFIFG